LYRGGDSYAHLLPLLPWAARHHDLSGYDLVVTSHHQFANRIRPDAAATVLSYVHSPARWMWDPDMRAEESGGLMGRAVLASFARTQQRADRQAAQRPQQLVANSHEVAKRIANWWGRSADVISPPVDVDFYRHDPGVEREEFFLLAGRLVPYKRPEVAVAAAARARVPLVVAGDGRARGACEAVAGTRTEFIGSVDDTTMRDLYRRCGALLYPGREDFGIVPVEAQSCGAPVIAVAAGGALDTVDDGVNGVLYGAGPGEITRLTAALRAFDEHEFDHAAIARGAQRYNPERFRAELAEAVRRTT
jgi:glycosyltransferase involved in cell wall biosynthesis